MSEQPVPARSDGFAETITGRQPVILGPNAGDVSVGIKNAPQQVGRQQTAFRPDGLELRVAAGHVLVIPG